MNDQERTDYNNLLEILKQERTDYNNLVAIVNEVVVGWEKLDEYRAEKDSKEKMKKLFAVHSHETKAKKLFMAETTRLELKNPKNIAA